MTPDYFKSNSVNLLILGAVRGIVYTGSTRSWSAKLGEAYGTITNGLNLKFWSLLKQPKINHSRLIVVNNKGFSMPR